MLLESFLQIYLLLGLLFLRIYFDLLKFHMALDWDQAEAFALFLDTQNKSSLVTRFRGFSIPFLLTSYISRA